MLTSLHGVVPMLVHFTLKHIVTHTVHTTSLSLSHTQTHTHLQCYTDYSCKQQSLITRNVFCEISVYRAAKSVNAGYLNPLRLNYNFYIAIQTLAKLKPVNLTI